MQGDNVTSDGIKILSYYYNQHSWNLIGGMGAVPPERDITKLSAEELEIAAQKQRALIKPTQTASAAACELKYSKI